MLYIHILIYKYTIVQKYEFTCLSLYDITFEIGLNHMSLLLMSIMSGAVIPFIDFLGWKMLKYYEFKGLVQCGRLNKQNHGWCPVIIETLCCFN